MAQTKVTDLKLDYSRDYQPLTMGPGGGYFSFRAIDGAGGKRLASVAYLIPGAKPGEYDLLLEQKQEGKGRLSAYNESLVRSIERALVDRLRKELIQGGWRETTEGAWVKPELADLYPEDDLKRVYPEDLEPLEELASAQSTELGRKPGYDAIAGILEAAETLPPNGMTNILLPNGVVCILLHQEKFVRYLHLISQAEAQAEQ